MTTVRRIVIFFDHLEDKVRSRLSRYPILYGFIGGIGVVLFWRGVWHTYDMIMMLFISDAPLTFSLIIDGPLSFTIGTIILLMTGVFVSEFVGKKLIISGMAGEKKLAEKAQDEIQTEEEQIEHLQAALDRVEEKLDHLDKEIESK